MPPGTFSRISSMTVTPDGNFVDLVAVKGSAQVPDVWRIPLLGGPPRQLLSHVVSAIGWSPNGQTMAFVRSEDPAKGMTVVTADPDGSNQRELVTRHLPKMFFGDVTTQVGRPASRPAWSPDGELLLLAAYSTDSQGATSELVLLDARTGAERRSVRIKGVWPELAWLDQTRLLLLGGTAGLGLWISDLTGNLLTPVTREFGNFANMSLTADRYDRRCEAVQQVERNLGEQWLGSRRRGQGPAVARRRLVADPRYRRRSDAHGLQAGRQQRGLLFTTRHVDARADRRPSGLPAGRYSGSTSVPTAGRSYTQSWSHQTRSIAS